MAQKTVFRSRIIILLLFGIFVIPMLGAWFAYSGGMFLNNHTVNHGVLIRPPLAISQLNLTDQDGKTLSQNKLFGKWWLVYVGNECDEGCKRQLYYIRQIRQATGKDRERIERALITVGNHHLNDWLKKNYPDTHYFIIPATKKLALTQRNLYLVDPLGNIMMFYTEKVAPKGILKDLERVLKVSQIG